MGFKLSWGKFVLTDDLRLASLFRSDSTLETFPLTHTGEELPSPPAPLPALCRTRSQVLYLLSPVSPLGSCGFRVWGLAPWPLSPGHTVVLVVAVCLGAFLPFTDDFVCAPRSTTSSNILRASLCPLCPVWDTDRTHPEKQLERGEEGRGRKQPGEGGGASCVEWGPARGVCACQPGWAPGW